MNSKPLLARMIRRWISPLLILALWASVLAACAPPAPASTPTPGPVVGPALPPGGEVLPSPPDQPAPNPPSSSEAQGASASALVLLHTNDVAGYVDPCG